MQSLRSRRPGLFPFGQLRVERGQLDEPRPERAVVCWSISEFRVNTCRHELRASLGKQKETARASTTAKARSPSTAISPLAGVAGRLVRSCQSNKAGLRRSGKGFGLGPAYAVRD